MKTGFARELWIGLSIIFGSMAVAAVVLYFLAGDISYKSRKIIADRILVNQQSNILGTLAALKQAAPIAATYQAAMEKLLPTQDGLIYFSQWVADIANREGVVANVNFQGTPLPSSEVLLGRAPFSLQVSGSLNNIAAFLADMESKSTGFLMQMGSFTLTAKGLSYQLDTQGNVFFR